MKTDIWVAFPIPEQAMKILRLLQTQNSSVGFEVDEDDCTVTLYADMLDFDGLPELFDGE